MTEFISFIGANCFFKAPRGTHTNVYKRSPRLCLTVLVGYQKLSDNNLLKDIQQLWLIKEIRQQYFSISPPPLKLKHFQAAGLNPALSKCLISLHGISTHWLPPNGADFSSQPSNNSPEQPGADGTNATRESRFHNPEVCQIFWRVPRASSGTSRALSVLANNRLAHDQTGRHDSFWRWNPELTRSLQLLVFPWAGGTLLSGNASWPGPTATQVTRSTMKSAGSQWRKTTKPWTEQNKQHIDLFSLILSKTFKNS